MEATAALSAAGGLSWGGDAWQASLQRLPGIVKILALLARDARLDKPQQVSEEQILGYLQQRKVPMERDGKWYAIDEATDSVTGPYESKEEAEREAHDTAVGIMLVQAFEQIRDASPNFLSPPVRGTAG